MRFGICTAVENAPAAQAAGWEFVEENVQGLLQGQLNDAEWTGLERARRSALPVLAANVLVPAALKITGPDADPEKLRPYMATVLARAQQVGIKTLVFGSGGARKIPDGFDRDRARRQIIDFVRTSAELAAAHGVTLVAEPLNRKETNVINSVGEAMEYVRAVNHPNFQCLVDSWHFWLENDSSDDLRAAMPWIKHVHLADTAGRLPPGQSGASDYRPFFHVLKEADYQGPLSVEASGFNIEQTARTVLEFIKTQWNDA